MRVSRDEKIKLELQMLTGVITDDISYLCYLMLKDGVYFKKERDKEISLDSEEKEKAIKLGCESFDSFFDSI